MFISKRGLLALALVCVVSNPATAEEPWKDRYGDLLPPDCAARIGTVRLRPGTAAKELALSPDGKLLVSAARRDLLQIWDATTGQPLRTIETAESKFRRFEGDMDPVWRRETVLAFAFTADARRVHALTNNGLIRACDVTTGKWSEPLARSRTRDTEYHQMQAWGWAAPDGTHFLYTPDNDQGKRAATEVLVVGQDKPAHRFELATADVRSLSADNRLVVLVTKDRTACVREWKTVTTVATFAAPVGVLHFAQISPDGKYLTAVCGPDAPEYRLPYGCRTLVCWEVATQKERFRAPGWDSRRVSYSPDGARLVGFESAAVVVADAATGAMVHRLRGHAGGTSFAAHTFSANGKLLATGGEDGAIVVWNLATGTPTFDFDSPRGPINVLAVSPDGKTLFTGWSSVESGDLWDVQTGKRLHLLDPRACARPFAAAFAVPLAIARPVHDRFSRRATRPLAAVFTPDGTHVVVGCGLGCCVDGDYAAQLWRVADGKLVREFRGHTDSVYDLSLSPDGKQLATLDYAAGKVWVWELDSGKLAREIGWVKRRATPFTDRNGVTTESFSRTHHVTIAFSTTGQLVGVAADSKARQTEVVDLLAGKVLGTWKGTEYTTPTAISPDGQLVAVSDIKLDRDRESQTVVRRITTGEVVCALTPASPETYSERVVLFSPNSKLITHRGSVYELATGRELRTLKGHASGVASVAFSPDGKRLATGGYDSTVLIWDLKP